MTVYIEQIIEVAVRATLAVDTTPDISESAVHTAKDLSAELLERLEQTCGSDVFMGAYSAVQQRVVNSKAEKRRQLAAEAVREPQKYAMRKVRYSIYLTHFFNAGTVSLICNCVLSDSFCSAQFIVIAGCQRHCKLQRFSFFFQMENAKKKHEGKKRQTLKHAAIKGLKRKTSRSATVY